MDIGPKEPVVILDTIFIHLDQFLRWDRWYRWYSTDSRESRWY
jgi:hypothetical protein